MNYLTTYKHQQQAQLHNHTQNPHFGFKFQKLKPVGQKLKPKLEKLKPCLNILKPHQKRKFKDA